MELKLKSLLADPKLKSGAKAFALALSLAFLPFWAFAVIFSAVFLPPFTFPVPFVFSAAATVFSLHYFASAFGYYWAFFIALDIFFALFAVKNYAVVDRQKMFLFLSPAVFLIVLYGFMAGAVSLLSLSLITFALAVDLFSFAPEKNKHYALAGVLALITAEVAWVINLLGIAPYFSVPITLALVSAAAFALIRHLQGSLLGTNALYLSLGTAVIATVSVFIALFS